MELPGTDPSAAPEALARIVDANLNRSAEALRVLEDLVRFYWNLPGLAGELKQIRHNLLELCVPAPAERAALARSRDIEGDVGRDSSVAAAAADADGRLTADWIAVRNLERLKESLRALEESSRAWRPALAAPIGKLRYQVYSLEKGLLTLALGAERRRFPESLRLYLLWTPQLVIGKPAAILAGALRGGVGAVQLRAKGLSDREALRSGRELRETTARTGARFVVNDRADLALALGADALHLGQEDLPVAEARRALGNAASAVAVGVSTHSLEQARRAVREGADYIGIGPCFPSATKDAGPPLGPEIVGAVVEEIPIPAFAIGGIDAENIPKLAAAGVRRVAVAGAILRCPDGQRAEATARRLLAALDRTGGPIA
jgi:thiamine-phosphate pyrophosphorylase